MQIDFPLTARVQSTEITPLVVSQDVLNKILVQMNYFRSSYDLWKKYVSGVEDKHPTNPFKYQLYKFNEIVSKTWHLKYYKLNMNLVELAKIIETDTNQFRPISLYLFKHAFKSMNTISIFC